VGAPRRRPLTWAQTDSTVVTPLLLPPSLFYQPHRPEGLTERQRRGGGANEHNEQTDTATLTSSPLPPFIFGYGSLYSLRAAAPPPPSFPSFIPQQPVHGEWPRMPLVAIYCFLRCVFVV